jgi:hypothetical protein
MKTIATNLKSNKKELFTIVSIQVAVALATYLLVPIIVG